MGVPILGSEMTRVAAPTPQYLLGSGRVEAVKAAAQAVDANLIILDDELSPAQQRNWEKLTEVAVIDRREVIIDIFKQRARTGEARLQVELARLEYSLPRLARAWTHLERQRGGGGFIGGAGEAQIETDRRIVRDKIAKIKRELEDVRRQRATQRKGRQGKPVPTASLVGYTNAGKSSLLNALTGASVLAEDKLFATLDPTSRRLRLPSHQEVVLTDTVGFVRKLPHQLVEAFLATLEEAKLADLLFHVVDASHPAALHQIEATNEVLKEIGAADRPMVYVLNKIDLVQDREALALLRAKAQPAIAVSALTGEGLAEVLSHLTDLADRDLKTVLLRIPAFRADVVALLHREGHVVSQRYEEDQVVLEARVADREFPRFAEFLVEAAPSAATPVD